MSIMLFASVDRSECLSRIVSRWEEKQPNSSEVLWGSESIDVSRLKDLQGY